MSNYYYYLYDDLHIEKAKDPEGEIPGMWDVNLVSPRVDFFSPSGLYTANPSVTDAPQADAPSGERGADPQSDPET